MKYCSKCGAELQGDGDYCLSYGTAQIEATPKKNKWSVLSIIGFVISILSVLIDCFFALLVVLDGNLATAIFFILALFVGCVVGALGVIVSSIGLGVSIKKKQRGKAFAIIGLVLGLATFMLFFLFQAVPNIF